MIFGLIALLMIFDVAADISAGAAMAHTLLEALIALISLAAVVVLTWEVVGEARDARRQAAELGDRLQETRIAAEEWRKETQDLLQGLGAQIDKQFSKWELSGAEREVALFLLKGFSHRDISELRRVSERVPSTRRPGWQGGTIFLPSSWRTWRYRVRRTALTDYAASVWSRIISRNCQP